MKKAIFATLLASISLTAAASSYYMVTPTTGKPGPSISVSLSSFTLPGGTVGQAYVGFDLQSLLQVTGDPSFNGGRVTWAVTGGALPEGVVLNANGTLSGTPTVSGGHSFVVSATYKSKTGTQTYDIAVGLTISVALAPATLPAGQVGTAYQGMGYNLSSLLSVDGDPAYNGTGVVWSVSSGSLPTGLSLSSSGVLSGTPTEAGTRSVTLQATYKTVNGTQTYSVVVGLNIGVALASSTLPDGVVGVAYTATSMNSLLTVTGDPAYVSGSGVTWVVASGTLPAGLVLNSTTGVISGTPTVGGTSSFSLQATYKTKSGVQSYTIPVSLNISVALAAGSIPAGEVGVAYAGFNLNTLLSVSGDPAYVAGSGVTWSIDSGALPSGLTLNSATGAITGTPDVNGTRSFTVKAAYKTKTGSTAYSMQINLHITVDFNSANLPSGKVGTFYSYDLGTVLVVTGDSGYSANQVTWAAANLPNGMYLSGNWLQGSPVSAGTASIPLTATYKGVSNSKTYSLSVAAALNMSLNSAAIPAFAVGSLSNYDLRPLLSVSGDPAYQSSNVVWTVVGGMLPAGLTLSSSGFIYGNPMSASSGLVTIQAEYNGSSTQQSYGVSAGSSIQVDLMTAALTSGVRNSFYNFSFANYLTIMGDPGCVGSVGPCLSSVTWSVAGAPSGLSMNSMGELGGMPTTTGTYFMTITATYKGVSVSKPYSVMIN